jgi:hypothetical protein
MEISRISFNPLPNSMGRVEIFFNKNDRIVKDIPYIRTPIPYVFNPILLSKITNITENINDFEEELRIPILDYISNERRESQEKERSINDKCKDIVVKNKHFGSAKDEQYREYVDGVLYKSYHDIKDGVK